MAIHDGNAIETRSLRMVRNGTVALDGASFDVPKGKFVSLTGHSGSGKSTALEVIAGIVQPDAGEVRILGQAITDFSQKQLNAFKREHVGIGFQKPMLDRSFTVREAVKLDAEGMNYRVDNARIMKLAGILNIMDQLDKEVGMLSGGQLMRAELMGSILVGPEVLLADEPTAALDQERSHEVFAMMRTLASEDDVTILMVTHDPDAKGYVDQEIVLEAGQIQDVVTYDQAAQAPVTAPAA